MLMSAVNPVAMAVVFDCKTDHQSIENLLTFHNYHIWKQEVSKYRVNTKWTRHLLLSLLALLLYTLILIIVFFLLKPEWQQVSSSIQDSSKYSKWSQKCCSLYDLNSSSAHQLFFPSPLGPVPSEPNTIGITVTPMFHSIFRSLASICQFLKILFLIHSPQEQHKPLDDKFLSSFNKQ